MISLWAIFTSPITWITFTLGSIVGSFLNVCILRIPEKTFWSSMRSVCPSCGSPIPFYLNIPILAYIFLRGKAKCCGAKLSPQYPLVELLTAVMFVIFYWQFPFVSFVGEGFRILPESLLRCFYGWILVSLLIVCSVIDLRLMIIPDVISLPMIACTPLVIYFHPDLSWQSGLFGVIIGGGILYAVAWTYWLIRREEGMGLGDVKLLAAIGGWMGYQAVMPTIFYASILGASIGIITLVVSRNSSLKTAIPFGPFLAVGALFHLLAGPWVQQKFLWGQ